MFLTWSRYLWLASTSSPRSFIRRPSLAIKRVFVSSFSDGLVGIAHRNTAFDATLLTFWPPGPELRTNEKWISRRGIAILEFTRIVVSALMPANGERQLARSC